MFLRILNLALFVGLSLALSGCEKSDTRLAVRPVRGQVFYQNRPAVGAMIVLHPQIKSDERAVPRGKVDEQGHFRLSTYDANDGAPVGKYKVTIDWRQVSALDPNDDGVSRIPAIYTNPDTSPLEVEITASTDELPAFQLR